MRPPAEHCQVAGIHCEFDSRGVRWRGASRADSLREEYTPAEKNCPTN